MKKFIKKTLLFIIPIALLAFGIDSFISFHLKQSNEFQGEFEVWNDIYKGNINADVLVYGSSRAWVDISPNILEDSLNLKVYNLGLDGHNFWLQYLRHLEYLKFNTLPEHIILTVDFNSLQKRNNLYLNEQFLPYMLWNSNIKEYTQSYNGFNVLDYHMPLLRYIGKKDVLKQSYKKKSKKNHSSSFRSQGYKGIEKTWTNDFELAKAKMKNYKIKIDTASVTLFDEFLLECKKNNIKVTLVYTPEYIEGQLFINKRDSIIKLYEKYAEKYNLVYLNYSEDSICLDKSYFYNATHLNKTGSELFTKKLANDLLSQQFMD